MSSFLDRWLYRDTQAHNIGTRNGNTGSAYNRTGSISGRPKYEHYFPAGVKPNENTTPNLTNVPWAYYTDANTSRRGSNSSNYSNMSSDSSKLSKGEEEEK